MDELMVNLEAMANAIGEVSICSSVTNSPPACGIHSEHNSAHIPVVPVVVWPCVLSLV
jgi:hypothetical protein